MPWYPFRSGAATPSSQAIAFIRTFINYFLERDVAEVRDEEPQVIRPSKAQ